MCTEDLLRNFLEYEVVAFLNQKNKVDMFVGRTLIMIGLLAKSD